MPTITRELVISMSKCSAFSPGGGSIYMFTYSSIRRQHTSAYVNISQHTSAYVSRPVQEVIDPLLVPIVGFRLRELRGQHTSAYVSIRRHPPARTRRSHTSAIVSIRQHTSAFVSVRRHTSVYVGIRQHMSAYVSIRYAYLSELVIVMGEAKVDSIREHTASSLS